MPTLPEQMRIPKSFWIAERGDSYSDWTFGFWRELFQNEVDAGAKRIDVTISEAEGKGSFGQDRTLDKVIRVTFQGDGHGMDERVLREVFLTPGESTKRNGAYQGGFGTARVMLCFSQDRYSVRTQDWLVEGNGNTFTCLSVPEAIEAKRAELAEAIEDGAQTRAAQLRADMAALEAEPGRLKGCRLEIDIDPNEYPEAYRNTSVQKLSERLSEYLSMSQIGCKVFVNGREAEERTLKGPARRRLVAQHEDGTSTEFATVHTSLGERAKFKGQLVVRSSGAAMYATGSSVREQVVVEIDPELSRKVLTQTRDGLKRPYSTALSAFLTELSVDTVSALKDQDRRKHIKVEGEKGPLEARLRTAAVALDGPVVMPGEVQSKSMARYTTREEYEAVGYGGAPREAVDGLIEALAAGETTFLPRLAGSDARSRSEATAFSSAVQEGRGADALRHLGPEMGAAVAGTLLARAEEARRAADARMANMHDVHIQVDDIDGNEKLKQAVRRYKPDYWRRKGEHLEGRGMKAHMALAAWTSCCEEAVSNLLSLRPDAAKDGALKFATGFYFSKSSRRYVNGSYQSHRTLAQHQERDDVHILLVNPVDDAGQPALDLTKARRESGADKVLGIQDLEALACEEVAHILEPCHDEDYAMLLRDLMATFNRTRAHERMRETVAAVGAVYGRGPTLVQSMQGDGSVAVLDAEEAAPVPAPRRPTPRPAEVLLAHAAPLTTIAAGIAGAPENAALPTPALHEAVASCMGRTEDGVMAVDCDRLQSLEASLATSSDMGWDLDAVALPEASALPDMTEDGGMDIGGFDIGDAAALPELAPDSAIDDGMNLGALKLPPLSDLPDMGAEQGMDLQALDIGDLGQIPPMPPQDEPLATIEDVSPPPRWPSAAAPKPPADPAAVEESHAQRGAALVGEEFDLDDLDGAPGPSM